MNSLFLLVLSLLVLLLGYRFYGRFLAKILFSLDNSNITPANKINDGIDYVPAKRSVLFGHHFASIAGLGPILGPAIAVIWGWVPAVLWVLLGSVFMGAVHDFTTLVVSERNNGRSIGDLTSDILNKRARNLFLLLIFFLLSLAMGVFVYILTKLFTIYPESVFPIGLLMGVAVAMGIMVYKKGFPLSKVTLAGVVLTLVGIYIGKLIPVSGISGNFWILILLSYAFIASILPVWMLLQPRDYLNSFQLFISMGLLLLGVVVFHPPIAAPPFHSPMGNAPLVLPFIFITIACGAISGFHNLVSSGTTAKQLNRERDALPIGYGGMLTEGLLALIVILATTAALGGEEKWFSLYGSWDRAKGLEPQLKAFVTGASNILSHIGIPVTLGIVFITVVIVSFALTTLDTATRLLRFNIEEIGKNFKIKVMTNRYVAGVIAVVSIGFFAKVEINGKPAGVILWQLFGTGNQLLAALGLLTITIYLYKKKKPLIYTLIPFVFMLLVTSYALIISLVQFAENLALNKEIFIVGVCILILSVWMVVEAILFFVKERRSRQDIVST